MFDLAKNTSEILNPHPHPSTKIVLNRIPPKPGHNHGDITAKSCIESMNGSHFIMQTSKFSFISTTDMNFSQVHVKVIQHISPDIFSLSQISKSVLKQRSLQRRQMQWQKQTENISHPHLIKYIVYEIYMNKLTEYGNTTV